RYRIDLAALSREASMDWEDLAKLAADPLVTIGSATVNYPVLANMKDAAALREMTMGKAVAEAAFARDIRHLAFPFGDRASFRRSHVIMAEEAGFASAVTTIPRAVHAEGRTNLRAMPSRAQTVASTRSRMVPRNLRVRIVMTEYRGFRVTCAAGAGDYKGHAVWFKPCRFKLWFCLE